MLPLCLRAVSSIPAHALLRLLPLLLQLSPLLALLLRAAAAVSSVMPLHRARAAARRPITFPQACVIATLFLVAAVQMSPNNHAGTRLLAAASLLGATWPGVLVGAVVVRDTLTSAGCMRGSSSVCAWQLDTLSVDHAAATTALLPARPGLAVQAGAARRCSDRHALCARACLHCAACGEQGCHAAADTLGAGHE